MKTLGSIVKDANRDLYTVPADDTVQSAVQQMVKRNIGAVIVVDRERVVGLFSERDLMKRVVAQSLNPESVLVRDVMTTELIIGEPEQSYEDGIRKMHEARCRHLPILEKNNLLGIVSLRDLLEFDVDEKAEEIRTLHTYIHYLPPGLQ
jgi:CBS domain-containing protein